MEFEQEVAAPEAEVRLDAEEKVTQGHETWQSGGCCSGSNGGIGAIEMKMALKRMKGKPPNHKEVVDETYLLIVARAWNDLRDFLSCSVGCHRPATFDDSGWRWIPWLYKVC